MKKTPAVSLIIAMYLIHAHEPHKIKKRGRYKVCRYCIQAQSLHLDRSLASGTH